MGNTLCTTLYSRPAGFTASDRMLDQMEKQDCVATTTSWMESAAIFLSVVLSTLAALLLGNYSGPLDQHQKKPILVDAACQTEDEDSTKFDVDEDWPPFLTDRKEVVDDDIRSCTTEATDLFTDIECEDDGHDFSGNDSEWENVCSASDDTLYALQDACESCIDCDCEIQAEQLLHLTAVVCAENPSDNRIYIEDYLCTCGECPQYDEIAQDIATETAQISSYKVLEQESAMRLLQAFSTYNEVIGYRPDMIPAAYECLRVWSGDEDKAFKSFVTLYDDVPLYCDTNYRV
ncbi:unnamed protein product [Phytophthora fragariaefolia]|uniref:Unnamed protein product n=1 Tax=Phytophthora fragariaefolia TaxID=1490495 RepID=A0A9W6YMJ0_9STRA|nr:unnamed protein product [Phytophthora fragariaefolia]